MKAVVLGLTNSGKSTAAEIIKKKGWPVVEVDDLAQTKNNGIWPEDEVFLDKLFKESNEEILKANNVVFVTSFLETNDVKRFHQAGFKIIELHASYQELVRRKVKRDGVPNDKYERFNRNYANYQKIMSKVSSYVTLSLDTTGVKSEAIATIIEKELTKK